MRTTARRSNQIGERHDRAAEKEELCDRRIRLNAALTLSLLSATSLMGIRSGAATKAL
jgi:hypothetical protein